jgi:hypothetical protein
MLLVIANLVDGLMQVLQHGLLVQMQLSFENEKKTTDPNPVNCRKFEILFAFEDTQLEAMAFMMSFTNTFPHSQKSQLQPNQDFKIN